MTPIDLETEYMDEFTPLTEEVNDTRLVHLNGIQFAIIGPLNVVLFAFESIALAAYICHTGSDFSSFRFAQSRTGAGADPEDQKLLFVWMLSGHRGILLNERDELTLLERLVSDRAQSELVSATKAFGLPPKGHLARMLMTARLIQKIEAVSEGHGTTIEQILYLIYRESAKACRSKSNQKNSQTIAGEHFIFETRPFNDQLTVFDLIEQET
jgi:hypothetical protein